MRDPSPGVNDSPVSAARRLPNCGASSYVGGMEESPRVKAGLFVSMALRLGDMAGRPGAVLRKGDADVGGHRASADRALDQARGDRATSSGVLIEAPAPGMRTQDSQRPSPAHRGLAISGTETSSKAARQ